MSHPARPRGLATLADAMPARVRISEVAKAANVSVTTVSDALNGKGRMTADTRDHVRRVAAELGYRPHRGARELRSGRTGVIALILSTADQQVMRFADYDYFRRLIDGAASEALARGKWLVLMPSSTARRLESPVSA